MTKHLYKRKPANIWRQKIYEIIFEADTPAGKAFDIFLIIAILLSVLIVLLDSTEHIRSRHFTVIMRLEWFFTILFTVEYFLRIFATLEPRRYIFSFFGVVDLLAIFPTYLSFFIPGAQLLLAVRVLRLLRLFRVMKMVRYIEESRYLLYAMRRSFPKITVFVLTVLSISVITGSLMYLIEGPENGFTSIPTAMYWAIVTLTTVGYGDISPQTALGKSLASLLMIMAYGILAVPTGIVTYELAKGSERSTLVKSCQDCNSQTNDPEASFCSKCGREL